MRADPDEPADSATTAPEPAGSAGHRRASAPGTPPGSPDGRVSVERGTVLRMLASADPDGLLGSVLGALGSIEARAGALFVTQDDGWLRMTANRNLDPAVVERFPALAPDAELPASVAVRERRSVRAAAEDFQTRYPDLAALRNPVGVIAEPLLVDDRCLGALVVHLSPSYAPDLADEQLISMVAAVCAHRLEDILVTQSAGLPAGTAARLPGGHAVAGQPRDQVRLELALAGGKLGSFQWYVDSDVLVWDARVVRLMGLSPDTFDARLATFLAVVHPDDRERVQEELAESLQTEDCHLVYRVVWPDGSLHWIEAKGIVERSVDGRPQSVIGVAWDATAQREREARREARRAVYLSVTQAFAAALSPQDVLATMIDIVLPELGARALALHMVEEGRLILEGSAGYPPEALKRLSEVGRVRDNPLQAALRAGHPLFFETRRAFLERFPAPELQPVENLQAFVFLPLATADGMVGTCLIAYDHPKRFSPDEETLATAVSGILGQSLARARLSDLRRRRMTDLQQLMMPRALPRLEEFQVAARYLPASQGMQVGGDWFDVLPRPDGGASLVIGDVQGHSAQAAAVMGQLRTALRAHASDGYRVEHLMRRGNQTLYGLDTERFATCCIVDVTPGTGHLQVVRAGHPRPLQAAADGTVCELEVAGGLPLGFAPDDRYPVFHGQLVPGSTLLLYTDGLVDRPGRSYDEALSRVCAVFADWARRDGRDDGDAGLEALAEEIVATASESDTGGDDIAILLIRRP
ncbi:PAS domain S-box protein [Streptomyces triticagri]|uniref:protein-serine/threonine phosphatase n=1 Tax=Streptomyces triticagri TaxID=2293568 RepID=A0A372LW89_9ACTN|nr:SpoIIE family protein phosphatase [Streptomyces triticagri]RFU82287.1 PAS domain S-box protein [Streptomyces triticagri]